MTRAQAARTVERVRLLVDYTQAWRDAHRRYRAWRNAEWQARRARYRVHERAARRALISLLRGLLYDARGRVRNDTGEARRRLRTFRTASDRVYARLLQAGRRIFGVAGGLRPDPKTGLYSGRLHPALLAAVKARLAQLMRQARAGIQEGPEP